MLGRVKARACGPPALRAAGGLDPACARRRGGGFSSEGASVVKNFKCYQLSLDAVRAVRPLIEQIEGFDRDLGRQLRRCVASVPLNVAEGSRANGRNAGARYGDAMGSARETIAALQTAEALGYLRAEQLPEVLDRIDHVVAMLFKMRRGR